MDPTDFKVYPAKVKFTDTGDFDDFYLHVIAYMYDSAYKVDSYTVTEAGSEENPHTINLNLSKDTSIVNIKEIETPLVATISLGELELGEESSFNLDIHVNKEGVKVLTKKVKHTDMSDYERPI